MTFKPTPKQELALDVLKNSTSKIITIYGGTRCGKTFAICNYMISSAIHKNNSKQIVFMKRNRDCIDNLLYGVFLNHIKQYFKNTSYNVDYKNQKIIFNNGSEIHFMGFNLLKENIVLINNYINAYIDNITECSFEDIIEVRNVVSPYVVIEDNYFKEITNGNIMLTCNPTNYKSWFYKYSILQQNPLTGDNLLYKDDLISFQFTPFDNIEHLGEEYIERLNCLPKKKKRSLLYGEWC